MEGRDAMARTAGSATRLTYDELVAMFPEGDRLRHELIAGEHFVTPAPANRHQELSVRLTISIGVHLEGHSEQGKTVRGAIRCGHDALRRRGTGPARRTWRSTPHPHRGERQRRAWLGG